MMLVEIASTINILNLPLGVDRIHEATFDLSMPQLVYAGISPLYIKE